MKADAALCSAGVGPSLGDLVFISPDLARTPWMCFLQVPALLPTNPGGKVRVSLLR